VLPASVVAADVVEMGSVGLAGTFSVGGRQQIASISKLIVRREVDADAAGLLTDAGPLAIFNRITWCLNAARDLLVVIRRPVTVAWRHSSCR